MPPGSVIPIREAVAFIKNGTMPVSGGTRDQPYLLYVSIEAIASGYNIERREQEANRAFQMEAMLNSIRR